MSFKVVYILFIMLAVGFLFLQGKLIDRSFTLPVFLQYDPIAKAHNSAIDLTVHCGGLRPNESQLEILKTSYDALWAHLNYLYRSNDVEKGKEYYTEEWFRVLCKDNPPAFLLPVTRLDITHDLHVIDWSTDGLVCALVDSNVNLKYTYSTARGRDSSIYTKANYAITLLFQGDHWRLDAFHLMGEVPVKDERRNRKKDIPMPLKQPK
jgi:hypothetical protein